MKPKAQMTKAQVKAWQERWRRVNEREHQELQAAPVDLKLRQLETLTDWAFRFGWSDALCEGVEDVRQRWIRLRKAYGG